MIAVDTNVLIYAHRTEMEFHKEASRLMRTLAEHSLPWCIPWPCLHEFFSIVTNKRIFRTPSTSDQALNQIRAWSESPSLMLISETEAYLERFLSNALEQKIRGPLIHDFRILLICEENGVQTLKTMDRDFSRFSTAIRIERPF